MGRVDAHCDILIFVYSTKKLSQKGDHSNEKLVAMMAYVGVGSVQGRV